MPITLLLCRNLVDGGIDNFTALHLGRSIQYSCQGLYHVWGDIVIVSLCIGLVVPQTDCSDICFVGTGECTFVLKTVLFTQQRKDIVLKYPGAVRTQVGIQMNGDMSCIPSN